MRTKFSMLCIGLLLFTYSAKAQFAVIDPVNIATSITNSVQQIVQTSSTAANMVNNFQETVKLYQQGKKYYDGAPI